MISLESRSLIVEYLQLLLNKSSYSKGTILENVDSDGSFILNNLLSKDLKITGKYDKDTYVCLSVYMANIYPNEGFPYLYLVEKDQDSNKDILKKYEFNKVSLETPYENKETIWYLERIIKNNLKLSYKYPEVLAIPDRVISYFLNSVVCNLSSVDEIYELQELLLEKGIISKIDIPGNYSSIEHVIKNLQVKNKLKQTGYFDVFTEKVI